MTVPSIVLVEDDPSTRALLTELLQVHGFDVLAAGDGAQALRVLEIVAPPCAIVLDLVLPKVDGWELLRHFAADPRLARIPVVVLTASGGQPPAGVFRFFRKPVDGDELIAALSAVCPPA